MSAIWLVLMLISLGALLYSNPSLALSAMMDGANGAVELGMKLVASYALWLGFFSLVESLGASKTIAKIMSPIVKFLFPSANEQAKGFISMNMSANLLGLGNASTPMGINAMKSLCKNGVANDDMIMLVVISATSLQLLPTTVISLRIGSNSIAPTSILLPCIVATVFSTLVGITCCKIISKLKNLKNNQPVLDYSQKSTTKKRVSK